MQGLVVGVDVATRAVRARCVDADGNVLSSGSQDLPAPASPRPGWLEQDARAWWPATAGALRQATEMLDPRRQVVRAVSVSATSGTAVPTDVEGRPLGPALMYADQRAARQSATARRALSARGAGALRIDATAGLAKLAWVLQRSGDRRSVARWCHVPDVIVARLTGRVAPTDWSHALKTGYDVVRDEWPAEVLDALGISPSLLPDVLPPASLAGHVTADAAAETGLPAGCEVRLGMTDGCCAQLAAGADRPGRFVSVLGTTLVLRGSSETLVADPSGCVYSHRHPAGWWLPGGASNTGGGALAVWDPETLRDLDGRAASVAPSCVCYPSALRGERFPFRRASASGFFVGEPRDEAERHRALMEGVAFVERLGYAHMRSLGLTIEPPVAFAGGASRSRVWNQLRAAVLGIPVVIRERAESAFGACTLAAAGSLHADVSAATDAMVRPGEEIAPPAVPDDGLEERFARLIDALAGRGWIGARLRRAALASSWL